MSGKEEKNWISLSKFGDGDRIGGGGGMISPNERDGMEGGIL